MSKRSISSKGRIRRWPLSWCSQPHCNNRQNSRMQTNLSEHKKPWAWISRRECRRRILLCVLELMSVVIPNFIPHSFNAPMDSSTTPSYHTYFIFIPLSLEGECWNIQAIRYLPITIYVEYSIFSTLQCLLRAHYKHIYLLHLSRGP